MDKKHIDIQLLNTQINSLISQLDTLEIVSASTKESLKEQYPYISECSNTLFNLITSKRFSKNELRTNVGVILENLRSVQNNSLDQFKASVNVGTHFSDKYFPKDKLQ